MNSTFRTFGIAALMVGLAVPAVAQMAEIDASTQTCDAYLAMDASGRSASANALTLFVNDVANVAVSQPIEVLTKGLETADVEQLIEAKCSGHPGTSTVLSVMSKT